MGCGNRLRRCGRRRRAGPPPPPLAEVCDARGGALPGPVPQTWVFHVTTYGGPRATLRGSGRVWLTQTASPLSHLRRPCAGLPSLALREDLFRMATYPPPALKGRRRVPSQPCSLTVRPKRVHAAHGEGSGPGASPIAGGMAHPDTPLGALWSVPGLDTPILGGPGGAQKKAQNCPDWESY